MSQQWTHFCRLIFFALFLTFTTTSCVFDSFSSFEEISVVDNCPNNPNKTEPGVCGCGEEDKDSDDDGVPDCNDGCENDRNKTEPGDCGCGVPEGCLVDVDDGFVLIEGGSFEMGDQFNEGYSNELPVHTVQLSDFMMSPTEVTNEEVAAFLSAVGNQVTDGTPWYEIGSSNATIDQSGNTFTAKSGLEQHPVIEFNWYGSVHFCNWKSKQAGLDTVYAISGTSITPDWSANGYRLPTEAEWEYAAREGGKQVRFGNGEDTARWEEMNFDASSSSSYSEVGTYRAETVPVNTLKKNSLGLYHMSGNVWEWCWDWYDSDYYDVSEGASDPTGPSSGSVRVVRGGSWIDSPSGCRASDRLWFNPSYRFNLIGFRLARHAP